MCGGLGATLSKEPHEATNLLAESYWAPIAGIFSVCGPKNSLRSKKHVALSGFGKKAEQLRAIPPTVRPVRWSAISSPASRRWWKRRLRRCLGDADADAYGDAAGDADGDAGGSGGAGGGGESMWRGDATTAIAA